ncbi:MAG: tandem-95 repeat protein [Sulfuricella denitrificans]|nr:tandem-95 repeat protein [Sulfuricella denitrificans]
MKKNTLHTKRLVQALALTGMVTLAAPVFAASYNLRAEAVPLTMPDGAVIQMWGYALDGASCAAPPCVATVPGPVLNVPPGDTSLTVNLKNNLAVPTSIVIPGQLASMTPVYTTNSSGKRVVQSFTHEAAANGGTGTYTWSNLKPGTYLYESGTHPQVQVQMGLYGGMTHDAASGQAYSGIAYDSQLLLLFSEIDPDLHAAVASDNYGPGKTITSTLDYQPRYFLVNGKPFTVGDAPLPLPAGQRTLFRFINAGLKSHVPVINGMDMELLAEDGNLYPWPRMQYSALLPAAKTVDAVVTPQLAAGATSANYPLYDRRLYLTSGAAADGGMFARLVVANGVHSPVMTSTPVTGATAGSLYNYQLTASDPDGGPLIFSLVNPPVGMTVDSAGLISWTPTVIGTQTVTARVTDPTGLRYDQVYKITVIAVNRAPITADDAATAPVRTAGATYPAVTINVLANDMDPDTPSNTIDPASVWITVGPGNGGTASVNGDGTIAYRPAVGFTGVETFRYKVKDTLGLASNPAAFVRVTVSAANQAPVLVDDTVTAPVRTAAPYPAQIINVLVNDSDPDGTIDPATVWITVTPNKGGWAVVNPDGTISYRPRAGFTGTETLRYKVKDNLGLAATTAAYVRVNVQ